MAKARKMGNNSLWSVDKADELLWEIGESVASAQAAVDLVAARGRETFDVLVVSASADARVALAEIREQVTRARIRLQHARDGRFEGDRENW